MPKDARVGFQNHDNLQYEIEAIINRATLLDFDKCPDPEENIFDDTGKWVILSS